MRRVCLYPWAFPTISSPHHHMFALGTIILQSSVSPPPPPPPPDRDTHRSSLFRFLPLFLFLCVTHRALTLKSQLSLPPFILSLCVFDALILCTVPVMQDPCVSFFLLCQCRNGESLPFETKSIIYKLSSVIFLVYSLFLGLPLPLFLSWVSHLIAPIILLLLTSSARTACCH